MDQESKKVKLKWRTKKYGTWNEDTVEILKHIEPEHIWQECRNEIMRKTGSDYVEIELM
jgi:hypothetical protein